MKPGIEDLRAADARIRPHAVVTPLLESWELSARTGGRVLVKAEVLQRTGSFKFRGALNRMLQLTAEERARGVVAYSSGNHAQAVALAARICGTAAVIVMPADAPRVKVDKTRAHEAEIVHYDRYREDRELIGQRLAAERGLTLVPPYEDPRIIAGQGTVGLEIARQAAEAGAALDALLVPCSGGGLTAGCAIALEAESPSTAIYAVEPQGFDDTARSLQAGRRVSNEPGGRSLCDALLSPTPGELTFSINQPRLAGGLVASDAEALAAMAFAFRELKIILEPGGAVALAAVLAGRLDCRGKTIAVLCSGGNVDADVFQRALQSFDER